MDTTTDINCKPCGAGIACLACMTCDNCCDCGDALFDYHDSEW